MLFLEGTITSGLHEAGDFIEKKIYKKQYKRKLGFIPYSGTLNIKLKNNITLDIEDQLVNKLKKINGEGNLGDVFFLEASISTKDNKINKKGAVLFPVKTIYTTNTLEFVAEEKLRDTMHLKDGDEITLKIKD